MLLFTFYRLQQWSSKFNTCESFLTESESSRKACEGKAYFLGAKMKLSFLMQKQWLSCYTQSRHRSGRSLGFPILDPVFGGGGLPAPRLGRFSPREETECRLYRTHGGSRGLSAWIRNISHNEVRTQAHETVRIFMHIYEEQNIIIGYSQ